MKNKTKFLCSICSKILHKPILLPCSDNICEHHLDESSAKRTKSLECLTCKTEYNVDELEICENKILNNLLLDDVYLSDEEKFLKNSLQTSLSTFHDTSDEYCQAKFRLELNTHEHFQEIRRQLDWHREKLIEKIDDIYLGMIDKTKKYEASIAKKLTNELKSTDDLATDLDKNLNAELRELNEQFRHLNIDVISLIKQREQLDETKCKIKSTLNVMNHIEATIKATNKFNSNIEFKSDSFGLIYLNDDSSNDELSQSKIVNYTQSFELRQLCEFNFEEKWSLLYRGSRDGLSARDFHLKCENQAPTLTIMRDKGNSFIFGGYTSVPWLDDRKTRADEFIFSLTNNDKQPCKMKINKPGRNLNGFRHYGPMFGTYRDLCAFGNSSYSGLSGGYFSHPVYANYSYQARTFLTGDEYFELDEIEVYLKE